MLGHWIWGKGPFWKWEEVNDKMNQLQTVQSLLLTFLGQVPCLANNQMFILIKEYNNSLPLLNMGTDKHLLTESKTAILFDGRHL